MDNFLPALLVNAAASLQQEPGCLQFDVIRPDHDPDMVFLYEVYTDEQAFCDHLMTDHFAKFDTATAHILSAKTVLKGPRLGTPQTDPSA